MGGKRTNMALSAERKQPARSVASEILALVLAENRMMTVSERVAVADDIRSRTRPTTEDSTDLIRRDRDER